MRLTVLLAEFVMRWKLLLVIDSGSVCIPERNFGEVAAGVWTDLYQARKADVDRFLFAYLLLDYIM